MTQYTQPVVGQQQQSSPPQQQQQQQQNTTTQTTNNNNSNNNNMSATPTTPATSSTNNSQTQTIAVQQPTNNNNYIVQQSAAAGGVPVYNPHVHAANMYVPAHHGMSGHHHPHHQPGAMYPAMIPAPLSSNVFVNNVTANVNLHGWSHAPVPQGAWVHSGGTPHYIQGDIPPEQGAPVMQAMGAMPVALPPTGTLLNAHSGNVGGGGRGRRGRGRGGGSGSRRDYNAQRHQSQQQQHHHHHQQQQQEGSPAPQSSGGQTTNQQQSQEQQNLESQQMMGMPYAAHAQYAAAQYPYPYPYFAPQQQMIHPSQSAAAQQAAGTPVYISAMPVYNGQSMFNYGYLMQPTEYQYVPAEDVMAGSVVDDRQASGDGSAIMWHPHMYADEYGMNPADMHSVATDDINHNSGSAAETPNSMLSPNYAPLYDSQMHDIQQQMGVMQIYDDQQMAQMQVLQSASCVPQLEDDLSECGSQRSAPIQMVPAGAILTTAGMPLQAPPSGEQQMQIHQQTTHLIPLASSGAAIMPIEQVTSTNLHQQQQPTGDNNVIDNHMQNNEFVAANNNMQTCESVTSLNEENLQQSVENIAQDYQQQQPAPPQQQHQQQQSNIMMDPAVTGQMDTYGVNNKIVMTEVLELQENVPKSIPAAMVAPIVTSTTTVTHVDVAMETTTMQNSSALQQQHHHQEKQQQQQMYQQDIQQPQVQPQYVPTQTQGNQSVPPQQQQQPQQPQNYKQQQQQQHQQQQQYQHQQLQTQPPTPPQHQQPQPHHHNVTPQQQQQHQTQSQQQQYTQNQQQQQQPTSQHYHNYDNHRKPSQAYGNQQQSRRKYDYHNHGANNDAASNTSSAQPNQSQQSTTKTMSWTNSSQHKKSTNTVAVTATPSSTGGTGGGSGQGQSGNYSKQSNSSTNSSTSTHSHATRTYTNQQHHNYQQQQQPQQQQQQQPQQHNYNYQQSTQTRNYGAMKMPSSPISTGPAPGGTMERKISQSSDTGKAQQTTSTASTTAAPHQFQQTSTNEPGNSGKQHTAGSGNRKQSHTTVAVAPVAAATPGTSASTTTADVAAPTINLAPPASATTPSAPSTPSWASLFTTASAASSNAVPAASITTPSSPAIAALSSTTSTAAYSQKPIAKVAPFESVAPVSPAPSAVTPGALSYSAASAQNLPPPTSTGGATSTVGGNNKKIPNTLANIDEFSLKFADFLTKYKSDMATISLRPRGLTNRSNYCYINSILQALLGCSPLYNLMRSIPKQAANLCEVKTPTINAMISFMSNFSNLPSGLRLRAAKGGKGNKDDLGTEPQCDLAFEPTEIYKLWNDSREEHVEGRQEDAEEFLSYILNKLNDEMLEVVKLIAKPKPEHNGQNEQSEGEEGDVWQMICNNRNKGSVTRQSDFGCTPLSDIFRGELRSRLQREGELPTDVIQPFFTLQLNIEKAATVKEALEILVGRDQLEGVTGSKSKQEVLAWQQMNVEKLPPILILHLKWFDYRSDGCTKILKKVEFPVDLKIDTKILASKKYSQKQRAYRLFAVVYHDGKEASKGHYITDVYHTGYGSWLRYDDSSVKSVSENHVLLPRTPRVPYLLYYRRCDTIPQQNNNNNGGGGNNPSASGNNASGANNTSK